MAVRRQRWPSSSHRECKTCGTPIPVKAVKPGTPSRKAKGIASHPPLSCELPPSAAGSLASDGHLAFHATRLLGTLRRVYGGIIALLIYITCFALVYLVLWVLPVGIPAFDFVRIIWSIAALLRILILRAPPVPPLEVKTRDFDAEPAAKRR